MDFKDYCKHTGANLFVWGNSGKLVKIKVPICGSKEHAVLNLTTESEPFLVVGDSAEFKKFLKLMLCRDYHPNEVRITEVVSDDEYWEDSVPALLCLTNVRQHVVRKNRLSSLIAYLQSAVEEMEMFARVANCFECPHRVYVFCGLFSDVFNSVDDITEEYTEARELLDKLINHIAAGSKCSIFFFEREFTQQITGEVPEAWRAVCFRCEHDSSKRAINTDIAGTLVGDTEFYMWRLGRLLPCEIPSIKASEYEELIHNILTSR